MLLEAFFVVEINLTQRPLDCQSILYQILLIV